MIYFWITTVIFLLFIYCKPSFPELEKLVRPVVETEESNGDYFEEDELDSDQDDVETEQDEFNPKRDSVDTDQEIIDPVRDINDVGR